MGVIVEAARGPGHAGPGQQSFRLKSAGRRVAAVLSRWPATGHEIAYNGGMAPEAAHITPPPVLSADLTLAAIPVRWPRAEVLAAGVLAQVVAR